MTPRIVCTTTLSLLLAATATACGDDGGGASGTDAAGSGSTATTTSPTTSPTTNPTTNPTTGPSTTDPTMPTTEPTSGTTENPTDTEDPETEGDSTGTSLDCPYTPLEGDQQVGFELVASGFSQPLFVLGDPVDTDVLYVVQKGGTIKRLEPGAKTPPAENWYEIEVFAGNSEMGLLGLAFHPDYETNSLVYVLRSVSASAWRVTEYEVGADGPDLNTGREVFGSAQPQSNHNGGMIQFGPDGMLYISVGDGGPQYDGCGNGQNTDTHLGTIIRIDPAADGTPDSATGCGTCNCPAVDGFDFTVPADNPFVGDAGVRDEIYAYGFRNPWRFSFDPVDGQLFVADVGQDDWEEVTVVEAGSNHGWGDMEGAHCHGGGGCDTAAAPGATNSDDQVLPVAEYQHTMGRNSITGLGNYRSCEIPGFAGLYFYSDLSTGEVWAVSYENGTAETFGPVGNVPNNMGPWGGGYNAYGDVFIAANPPQGGPGSVYRITAAK